MIALARVAAGNGSCVSSKLRAVRLSDSQCDSGSSAVDSGTLMLDGIDTVDRLAAIFAAAYPITADIPLDPCKDLAALHPPFAEAGLANCPMRTFSISRDYLSSCFMCGPRLNLCADMRGRQVPGEEWDQCQAPPSFEGACHRKPGNKHALLKWRGSPGTRALLTVSEVDFWQLAVPSPLLVQINAPQSSEDRHHSHRCCPQLAPRFLFDPPLDRGCHLVVATVAFGKRETVGGLDLAEVEELKEAERSQHVKSCFFAFVDDEAALATLTNGTQQQPPQPQPQPHQQEEGGAGYRLVPCGGWTLVVLSKRMLPFEDHNRNSRIPKLLMHMAFSHATYAMYVDAKLRFRKGKLASLWRFVSNYFTPEEPIIANEPAPIPVWVSPKHHKRASAYEEARCVVSLGLVPADAAQRQMDAYAAAGFPKGTGPGTPGLIEGEWHLRDLRSADQARIRPAQWASHQQRINPTRHLESK